MRLIDAECLCDLVEQSSILSAGFKQVFEKLVAGEPAVDAVPVVRCRDCASFEEIGKYTTNNGGTPFGYCYHWQYEPCMSPNEVDGDDFCSYGERKEDGNGRT